jgi:hypothetical protein
MILRSTVDILPRPKSRAFPSISCTGIETHSLAPDAASPAAVVRRISTSGCVRCPTRSSGCSTGRAHLRAPTEFRRRSGIPTITDDGTSTCSDHPPPNNSSGRRVVGILLLTDNDVRGPRQRRCEGAATAAGLLGQPGRGP